MARCHFRLTPAFVTLFAITLGGSRYLTAGEPQSQFRVFVIAVQDFDRKPKDASLYDPDIARSVKAAASDLCAFFSAKYNVTPVLMTSHEDTLIAEVKKKLDAYFSDETQYSINLVFVLTHGFGKWLPASTPYSSRLYLATSDTTRNNYTGVLLKL